MGDLPRRLGRFSIEQRLAEGTMADVLRGRSDPPLSRVACIKLVHAPLAQQPGFSDRLREELAGVGRLSHPVLVPVLESGEQEGRPYIVTELVDGAPLTQVLAALPAGTGLPVAKALAMGIALCRGLAHLHGLTDAAGRPLGLLHSDLSADKVMITTSGAVKLTESVIARAAQRAANAGTVTGRPSYLSPEQASGAAADKRSDQFALGIVLWEVLAGRRLFGGDTREAVLERVAQGEVPELCAIRPEVPREVSSIIDVMLATRRESRFPDLNVAADTLFGAQLDVARSADDVDLRALVPHRTDDSTMPNTISPLERVDEWEAFSSSEVFRVPDAPTLVNTPALRQRPSADEITNNEMRRRAARADQAQRWPKARAARPEEVVASLPTPKAPEARSPVVPLTLGAVAVVVGVVLGVKVVAPSGPQVLVVPPAVIADAPVSPPPPVEPSIVRTPVDPLPSLDAPPPETVPTDEAALDAFAADLAALETAPSEAAPPGVAPDATRPARRVVRSPADVAALLGWAKRAYLRGEKDEARRVLGVAEKSAPRDPEVQRLKALWAPPH